MRRYCIRTLAFAALFAIGLPAHGVQLDNRSFEFGNLNGWDYIGDTSAQTADLGVTPTHGQYAALLTTGSPSKASTTQPGRYSPTFGTGGLSFLNWLGLSTITSPLPPDWEAEVAWAQATGAQVAGGGGNSGLRQSVELHTGDVVSFDWNRVGDEVDHAFVLYYPTSGPFWGGTYAELNAPFVYPTGMDLAAVDRYWSIFPGSGEKETGWQSYSFIAPSSGDYTLAFGVFDRQDDGWMSALWLDNFKVGRVPEPGALGLVGLGLAGLGWSRRKIA